MKVIINVLLFTLFSFGLFGQNKAVDYQAGELLVQFDLDKPVDTYLTSIHRAHPKWSSLHIKSATVKSLGIYLLGYDDKKVETSEILDFLNNLTYIKGVQKNYQLTFRDSIPNDPFYGDQWGLEKIQAAAVWPVTVGGYTAFGDEIVVAIIDKGFDISHEDFSGNLWTNPGEIPNNGIDDDNNDLVDDINGWNYFSDKPDHPQDSHGTAVAGIIGAKGNNNIGVAGVNWDVKMMLFTTLFVDEIIAAYGYILDQRKKYNETNGAEGAFIVVTNASLGLNNQFCEDFPIWGGMYDALGEQGVISVAATTNSSGTNVDEFGDMPTTCQSDYLIAVTNTDIDDKREGGFGLNSIDLSAPGTASVTTRPGSDYDFNFGGTSAACPHVAGAATLLYSVPCGDLVEMMKTNPPLAALLVKEAILEGADPVTALENETMTGARLNVYNSMRYLHSYCIATPEERNIGNFVENYIAPPNFINVYPSPIGNYQHELFIDYSTLDFSPISIQIFNTLGQLIYQGDINASPFTSQTYNLDVFSWSNGTYFLHMAGIDEKITVKIIK